jgi:hypothetical protein
MGNGSQQSRICARGVREAALADALIRRTPAVAMRALRVVILLALALLVSASPAAVADEEATAPERNVKDAFLDKFAAYVEWPEAAFTAPDSPIVIGVTGDDALEAELTRITAGRQVGGRPLAVRRVNDIDALSGLHILFVGRADNARLQLFVRALQSRPVLLVTETEAAHGLGGIINFIVVDGRVRFWIANQEAEKRGLKLSSRLLSVAQNVQATSP